MAHFRRKRPKENQVQRNGEWSHPQIEKGSYDFSNVANKRRALSVSDTDIDDDYEYDPLDTTQVVPRPKKSKITREERAAKRAARLARLEQWRVDWDWWKQFRSYKEETVEAKEPLDLGKPPELIQPKRKRKN